MEGMNELHAKAGQLYIIGCTMRPGTVTFATELEQQYFPPDTDINELFNIFLLQYSDTPHYIIEIPKSSYRIAEALAEELNLRLVNGKPYNTQAGPFGLVCSADSCFTLEIADHSKLPSELTDFLEGEYERARKGRI